jgi:hypothetical protein
MLIGDLSCTDSIAAHALNADGLITGLIMSIGSLVFIEVLWYLGSLDHDGFLVRRDSLRARGFIPLYD